MFGYVRPFKPELKICEYDVYQGTYCGLCKQLGKDYGLFARMTLSYDFAFLAMVARGMQEKAPKFQRERCMVHPLKKRPCLCTCGDLSFVSACAMLMFYYKLKDNIVDSSFAKKIGYYCVLPLASRYRKKAVKRYPELEEIMEQNIALQQQTERREDCTLDMAAEHSARALGRICELLGQTETQKKVLHRFGFLIGRWVYLMDALDDLEEDVEKKRFNALVCWAQGNNVPLEDRQRIREYAQQQINMTTGEIALAYELMDIKYYKSILDNVIYLGFAAAKQQVISGKQEEKE